MVYIPLLGGAYQARSVIASAQRCVNLFPEFNPKDAPVPVTHYPTPGLVPLVQCPDVAAVRGLYTATNGQLFAVCGQSVYTVSPSFALTKIGTLTTVAGTPTSMIDNGVDCILVDGSALGYDIKLASNTFGPLVDSTGTFSGADRAEILDTFMLFNQPGTINFYSTHSNNIVFDPLYFAAKSSYMDPLVTLAVIHQEIWLLGTKKSEIWYDAGNPLFPFARLPGAYVEHGCIAKYSLAAQDIAVYWLGQNLQGQGIVLKGSGYQTKRISTHALEVAIQAYPRLDDAIGFVFQKQGHVFYVLHFPTANATWVWDEATELWHEWSSIDGNGNLNRHRSNCHAFAYGLNVVGDYQNGWLYALDPGTYTDNGVAIPRIRSFPHLSAVQGGVATGYSGVNSGRNILFQRFVADIECGTDTGSDGTTEANPPQISLRWSDTRGKTWGNPVNQSMGAQGDYLTQVQWRNLGMARDRVWELSWSTPAATALNGAFIDATVLSK